MKRKRVSILLLLGISGQAYVFCCATKPPVVEGWFTESIPDEEMGLLRKDEVALEEKDLKSPGGPKKREGDEVLIHKKKDVASGYMLKPGQTWKFPVNIQKLLSSSKGTRLFSCATHAIYSSRMNAQGTIRWLRHTIPIAQATLGSSDEELITIGADGYARAITTAAINCAWKVGKDLSAVSGIAGKKVLIGGTKTGVIRLWDTARGRKRHEMKAHAATIHGISTDAQGTHFACASADGTIGIYDTDGRAIRTIRDGVGYDKEHTFAYPNYRFFNASFDKTGQFLVAGSSMQVVRVWDIRQEESVSEYRGHTDFAKIAKFDSSDDSIIVSSGYDKNICLWEVRKLQMPFYKTETSSYLQDVVSSFQEKSINAIDVKGAALRWELCPKK